MNKGLSLWLDVLRCSAALAVLFGHMAHIRFTGGDYYFLREINIASDAVIVFFVISGFVIAYASSRDGNAGLYAFNRTTRFLTVVIPALILTAVLDAIGTGIDPSAYPVPYYQPANISDFLFRGLSLSTEWTGLMDRVRLGTNGPLWSLSYETGYYILFGVAVFCRGFVRLVLLALVALIVGLPILLLLPAWLFGVLVWRHVSGMDGQQISVGLAWSLAILPLVLLIAARIAEVPQLLSDLTALTLAPADHHAILGYSDEVAWNMLIALGIALHLIGVAHLMAGKLPQCKFFGEKAIRWLAGGTFSIYAIHYPVLHLMDALLPADIVFRDLAMLVFTMSACLVFAEIFERPISAYRRALREGVRILAPRRQRLLR